MHKFPVATLLVLSVGLAASTSGFTFLRVPAGARAVAMGGAFTAAQDDPMGLYWNPASLTTLSGQTFTSTYTGYLMDMQAGFAGWARPYDRDAVGASLNYFYGGSFDRTTMTEPTGTGEEFGSHSVALSGSYARSLSEGLSVGVSARFVYSSIDTYSGNAFMVDAGALYRPSWVTLGLAVRNAGIQTAAFYEQNDPLPTEVAGGASADLLDGRLTVAADATLPFSGDPDFALGAEFDPVSMLSVRVGGNLRDLEAADEAGGGIVDALAYGMGARWNDLSLDYAFKPFADLGSIHRISLSLKL